MPSSGDFGSQLRKLRPDWWQFNLNYDELNKRLVEVKREFGLRKALSSRSLTGETRTFAEILDQDVEKIVMFYLRAQGDLATRLWELRQKQILTLESFNLSVDQIELMCQKYRDLGQDVLDLLEYLDLNVLGLRKIIRKHDKQFDLQMGTMYFGSRMGQNSQLVQLYHQEGLCAIIGTIRRGFEDLYEAKQILLFGDSDECSSDYGDDVQSRRSFYFGPASGQGFMGSGATQRRAIPKTSYGSRRASSNSLMTMARGRDKKNLAGFDGGGANGLSGSHSGGYQTLRGPLRTPKSSPGGIGRSISSSFLSLLAPKRRQSDVVTAMNSSMSNLEPVLLKISEASDRVMKNQKESAGEYMAVHSMMGLEMAVRDMDRSDEEDSDDETALKGAKKKRTPRVTSNSGLFLSLFVTFLYQMNQYVVAPTSGLYSDKLGMSAGLSGLIIGLSPLAALVSAMIYSVWTNYSFKQPLVTSLVFLVSGNLFYAIALQCQSPHYIFVGRLLTGLGGPRGITRRYIADHVSLADRTEASSYFVTAGAMGLACGPLMSSLVSASKYSFVTQWNDTVIVQYELVTAPGWIMFLLFAVTLLAVLLGFKDPTIAKQKITNRVGGEKRRHTGKSSLSYLLAPFFYFFSPNPALSVSNSASQGGEKVGTGRYGAIPVQEQVVCVELGDILERGDYMDSQTDYSRESSEDRGSLILKSSFSASSLPLEPFIEVDESSSEPGTPDRGKDSTTLGSTSPRGAGISSAVNLCKTSSPAPYNALKPRREQSRSGDLGDNMSTSSSLKANSSIGTSRSTSRRSSTETLDSGRDTLSALDVRTNGKPCATSSSNGCIAEEDSQLYEAPAAMSSSGKFSLAGLGGTYTYNYSQRNVVEDDDSCWLCCDLFGAEVAVILFIYLINKIGQEMIVSSVPCLSFEIFGWDSQRAGFFMAAMGGLVLPFNILVSKLAKDMEDRAMMVNLNYLSFGSLIFLLHTRIIEYSATQYICGSILVFVFLNALEGVIMSLLSKLVSPELAKGTFNSGLLATEAGTLGRVIGDMAITGFSVGTSSTKLMNILFTPVVAGVAVCIFLSARYFDRMAV